MLSALEWLALEVKYLDPAEAFYVDRLGLDHLDRSPDEVTLGAGGTSLVLRTPGRVPRGGLHTHFAFSTPAAEYESWCERLEADFDLVEHRFGSARSLYCYDPDGNCVEIGERDDRGTGITGIFEVVLEVESLERAETFYTALGGTPVDRGSDRRRIRLDLGPVDVELWEPQLGIADARGGVHVDVGLRSADPGGVVDAVREDARSIERTGSGIRIRDDDGHYVTIVG